MRYCKDDAEEHGESVAIVQLRLDVIGYGVGHRSVQWMTLWIQCFQVDIIYQLARSAVFPVLLRRQTSAFGRLLPHDVGSSISTHTRPSPGFLERLQYVCGAERP